MQRKPVYNNNDLSIYYMGADEHFIGQELEFFRLSVSSDEAMYIKYPAASYGSVQTSYTFNTVTLKEHKETQRYIIECAEIFTNADKTVTEIIKEKDFYPMSHHDLVVRFKLDSKTTED